MSFNMEKMIVHYCEGIKLFPSNFKNTISAIEAVRGRVDWDSLNEKMKGMVHREFIRGLDVIQHMITFQMINKDEEVTVNRLYRLSWVFLHKLSDRLISLNIIIK